jgi:hypothetical protein
MDVGVAPWHQFAIVPDDAIDFIERNSHGLSPGLTLLARLAPWRCWLRLPPALYLPRGRLPLSHALRTCFCGMRKSSMFAEMPLDNRTVDKFAALAAFFGLLRPFETSPLRETT